MTIKIVSKHNEIEPFWVMVNEKSVAFYPNSNEIERVVLDKPLHGISKFKDDAFIFEELPTIIESHGNPPEKVIILQDGVELGVEDEAKRVTNE